MEPPIHITRRSRSLGALNRSYSSTSASDSSRLHRPRRAYSRQQLRSVNENSSLLVSPGPLESMLKTTTETGDIGLFSIRPARSSGNLHASSPRRRPAYGGTPLNRRPNGDGTRSYSLRDDRRWLPSYRDTTSEIISMYGSDSQYSASASSALTRPCDDMGNRSYSMTTCSSHRPPSQKASGDLQSQQQEGYLQRPRSPYPYPTRLKRPGVRPASPALTENGAVDYSKMVGIDRVSLRTVHGSYKPTYPQYGNRQVPRLRQDGTSSSESFSSYAAAEKHSLSAGLPLSPAPWGHRYRGRLGSSTSEHSLRTSSLTSILNMYQRSTCGPPTRDPSLRVKPPGTFYYDYSEGFDYTNDSPPPLPDLPSDIVTRSMSVCQLRDMGNVVKHHCPPSGPTLRSEEDIPSLGTQARNSEELDSQSREDRLSPQDTPRQKPQNEESNADSLGEDSSRFDTERSPFSHSRRYEEEEEWSVGTAVVHRRQNTRLTVRSDLQFSTPKAVGVSTTRSYEENMRRLAVSPPKLGPLADYTHSSSPAHYSQRRAVSSPLRVQTRRNTAYPRGFGHCGLASMEESSDVIVGTDAQDEFATSEDGMGHSNTYLSSLPAAETGGQFLRPLHVDDPASRGHKRNLAMHTINTNDLRNLTEAEIGSIVDRSRTPMLAPHPISPARQLRLQNSVPQLMKALPRSPGIPVRSESCFANFYSQDLEYTTGFSTPDPSSFGVEQPTMVDPMFPYGSNQQEPKFKMPSSPLASAVVPEELGDDGVYADSREKPRRSGSRNSSRNSKLKLKVSRGALSKMHAEGIGGRRNTAAGPAGEWSGPHPKPRGRPSRNHMNPGVTNMDSLVESAAEAEKTDTCDQEVAFLDSPCSSIPAPAIPDSHQDDVGDKPSPATQGPREVTSPTARSEARSSLSHDSCVSGQSPRGLKKRFPDLRVRLAESRLRSAETLTPDGRIGEVIEVVLTPPVEAPMSESGHGSKVNLTTKDGDGDNNASDEGAAGKHQGKGFRGRMSRWFKAARQVVMGACSGSGKRG
ncbi:uncharacterized protein QC761_110170 [Podospora bellae-mahoneyi]|uniref:Uncharacterized protein n=1 Tax=Podospora bellae-mahoneyi TaxID=2093777 RepID=A0ABR0FYE3_9PEZI|nr:hypothetical protein QC761_110170 [Podospora bellae-mahoneyi]